MSKNNVGWFVVVGVVSLLAWGLARAAVSRYVQRRDAIVADCRAEEKRLGLDRKELRKKFPTPEITLCRFARILPGASGEVVVRGTFHAGTKFLFSNDKIEVVKEALAVKPGQKESEYRATVKVGQSSLPDYAYVQSFQPATCRTTNCLAVYIGGKYEWDFTADNGWRIKLRQASDPSSGDQEPVSQYRAEFYRGAEPKAFETRDARLSCHQEQCHLEISEGAEAAEMQQKLLTRMETVSPQEQQQSRQRVKQLEAEMAKLQEKMKDFVKLSAAEQKELTARLQEVATQMAQAMMPKGVAEAVQEMERKKQEFGCRAMDFWLKAGAVEGNLSCGEKVGRAGQLDLKGTMKFLGS